jgi:lipoate-protein ligase A
MVEQWLLLIDGARNGPLNMAIDFELLQNMGKPVLRIYRWTNPTLSIGYSQSKDIVNQKYCGDHSIDICQRATGGRALFHQDEVTFSITLPITSSHYGSLSDVSSFARDMVQKSLLSLSIQTEIKHVRYEKNNPLCFIGGHKHELFYNGTKVYGSAQRRTGQGAMLHGSIILSIDKNRYVQSVNWPDERIKTGAMEKLCGLNDFLISPLEIKNMENALIKAYKTYGNIDFEKQILSADILNRAGQSMKNHEL